MHLKRVRIKTDQTPVIAVRSGDKWVPLPLLLSATGVTNTGETSAYATDMMAVLQADMYIKTQLQETADNYAHQKGPLPETDPLPLLPFQPASYRDFMLFEKHAIRAARGYARKFLPITYKITSLYENILKRTFPKFRPHPLWYQQPIYYMGNHLNFVTDQHPVSFPSYSQALDYELELGVVITKPLKNATAKEAADAIGGFVVFNDFSARDVQRPEMQSGFGPVKAKHFINAISAVVVTADEVLPHLNDLKGTVRINEETIDTTSTSEMYYSLGEAIAYASLEEPIFPGEFMGSGTLPGGCGMENNRWLEPGDTIEVSIERVGTLTNPIINNY